MQDYNEIKNKTLIQASGLFLTVPLPKGFNNWHEDEYYAYLLDNVVQSCECWDSTTIAEYVEDTSNLLMQYIKTA